MVQQGNGPRMRQFDFADLTPQQQAKAKLGCISFLAFFMMLIWLPSAYRFYIASDANDYRNYEVQKAKHVAESLDVSSPVKLINRHVVSSLLKQASASSIGRVAANFTAPGSAVSRSVVAWNIGSYMEPQMSRGTSAQVVVGTMIYVIFASDGKVSRCHLVGPESRDLAIDIDAGVWHTATAYSEKAVEIRTTFPKSLGNTIALPQATERLPGAPVPGSSEGKKFAEEIIRQCSSAQRMGQKRIR